MSKILIVEDEESIADLEKDYLELSGFEVEIENQGDTGLVRAIKEDFDLALRSAAKCVKRRIFRLSWFLQRRMILIKSADWALVRMTI